MTNDVCNEESWSVVNLWLQRCCLLLFAGHKVVDNGRCLKDIPTAMFPNPR